MSVFGWLNLCLSHLWYHVLLLNDWCCLFKGKWCHALIFVLFYDLMPCLMMSCHVSKMKHDVMSDKYFVSALVSCVSTSTPDSYLLSSPSSHSQTTPLVCLLFSTFVSLLSETPYWLLYDIFPRILWQFSSIYLTW